MQRVFFGIFTVIKDQSWTVLYNLLAITGKTILPFSVSRTWEKCKWASPAMCLGWRSHRVGNVGSSVSRGLASQPYFYPT